MSAPIINPEMALQQAAATMAEYVFTREAYAINTVESDLVTWESLTTFDEPLAVRYYSGNKVPASYIFKIDGEMADELIIPADLDPTIHLADDVYNTYFFERFMSIYGGHPHIICLRSLRLAREAKLRKDALLQAQRDRNDIVPPSVFEVGKDAMQANFTKGTPLSWLQQKSS